MTVYEKKIVNGDLVLKNKYGLFSKNELKNQLKEGHLTVGELGSIYGLKEYQIIHVLRSLEIAYRNDINDTRIINATIDKSLHQVIIGTLLGDAYMPGKFYSLGHGVSQFDYCYHVAERLHNFIASFGDFNVKSKTKKSLNFWTFRHNIFVSYLKRFYSRGMNKKYFNEESVYDLEPEGLAYWYMDDGKYNKYGAHLCVGNISVREGNILIDLLKRKFFIHSNLQVQDMQKNYYTIYIQAKSHSHFYELISPYVIKSMEYKIIGSKFPKISFSKELIVSRHLKLCKKAGRYIRYFGDKETQREVFEKCSYSKPKAEYINKIQNLIKRNEVISRPVKKILKEELIELFHKGYNDQQIADHYNVGRKKIASHRRFYGIARKNSRMTRDKQNQLRELFLEPNMTTQKAMKKLHLSFYKVKEGKNFCL